MRPFLTGFALLLPLSLSAFASEPQLRAGLWEMRMQSDALRGMQGLPPEQLEQMRKMGIDVPKIQNDAIVNKVCISKEMAERKGVPMMDKQESGCEVQNYKRSGNNYTANIICDGPQMKGKGIVKGSMKNGESFESTYDFDGTMEGRPVKHQQTTSGKWISADCGNVKPLTEMGKGK